MFMGLWRIAARRWGQGKKLIDWEGMDMYVNKYRAQQRLSIILYMLPPTSQITVSRRIFVMPGMKWGSAVVVEVCLGSASVTVGLSVFAGVVAGGWGSW